MATMTLDSQIVLHVNGFDANSDSDILIVAKVQSKNLSQHEPNLRSPIHARFPGSEPMRSNPSQPNALLMD
jgi:hypothetical protein